MNKKEWDSLFHTSIKQKMAMHFFKKSLLILISLISIGNVLADTNADIEKYKQSWVAKALSLQREIDLNAPFIQEISIGTHNSYNSASYHIPLIRYVDPNQTLSIYDQLEMGMRNIEFDAHWVLSQDGKKDILLCHGEDNHLGCSMFDRPFKEGLQELQTWLKTNPNEIVLLYIERHVDGHEPYLASLLDQTVGSFIFKPTEVREKSDLKNCVAIPGNLTKADILKAGKQLLIVTKKCDGPNPSYSDQDQYPFIWNDYVFAGIGNIPNDPFTFIDSTIGEDFKPYPDCGADVIYADDPKHISLWRMFEDRTKLSNLTETKRQILPEDIKELLHCDINWISMDMLTVNDARLKAAVWSWASDYPIVNHGQCAIYKKDEGIENRECKDRVEGYVCEEKKSHQFQVIAAKGTWEEGETMCQSVAGKTWHFSMPVNEFYMESFKTIFANNGLSEVWVNYHETQAAHWEAN